MTVQHIVQGAGVPTSVPPSLTAHYTDTESGDQYMAKGTATAADWVLVEKGGAGAAAVKAHEQAYNHAEFVTTQAMTQALATKVNAVDGKGLSTNDFTTAEKTKLAGLESSHFKGTFVDLAALQAGVVSPTAGDYADVDAGAGADVMRYLWDASDAAWKPQASATSLTAAQVKALYEANADTNPFTDAEKTKLAAIAEGGSSGGGGGNSAVATSTATAVSLTSSHDSSYLVSETADPAVLTIADQAAGGWAANAELEIEQAGAGAVKFAAGSGVTLRLPGDCDPRIAERYGVAKLKRIAENIWTLSGRLADYSLPSALYVGVGASPYLRAFSPSDWSEIALPALVSTKVLKIAVSPDRTMIALARESASGPLTHVLSVFQVKGWKLLAEWAGNGDETITDVAFSPNSGRLYVIHSASPYLTVFDTSSWAATGGPALSAAPTAIAVNPAGNTVVLGTAETPYLAIYDTATWAAKPAVDTALPLSPSAIAFDPHDEAFSVACGDLSTYTLTNPDTGLYKSMPFVTLPAGSNATAIAYSPNGELMAVSVASSPYLLIYNNLTGDKLAGPAAPPAYPYYTKLSFSQDGKVLTLSAPDITPSVLSYNVADWSKREDATIAAISYCQCATFSQDVAVTVTPYPQS